MYYHIKLESLNTVLGYGFDFCTLKVKKDGSYLLLTKHVKQTPEVYRPLETFLRKLN